MEEARDQVEEVRHDYEDWGSFQFAASTAVLRPAEPLVNAMLPKVELKTSISVYAEWTNWWSIYSVLVHENTAPTNAQKLAILRLYLDNDTRALIAYFKHMDVAITQLRRRFERNDFLTDTHPQDGDLPGTCPERLPESV